MNYGDTLKLLRKKCLEKNQPSHGFIRITTEDFDPPVSQQELYKFCQWLDESGYTKSYPGRHDDTTWFVHPSAFALSEWDIAVT
jgi:hypothetical protein